MNSGQAHFFRYFRPLDKRTGYVDSSRGVCFYIVLDYDTRTMRASASVCNGDNFSKSIANDIAIARFDRGELMNLNIDQFQESDTSATVFILSKMLAQGKDRAAWANAVVREMKGVHHAHGTSRCS